MIYIAHRGFRIGCDENTFQAFDRSVDLDMDYIELDVQLSQDRKIFVIHDKELDRTFEANGRISEKMSDELQRVKSRNFNQNLPTLRSVIERYIGKGGNQKKIGLMIELKGEKTGKYVPKLLKKMDPAILENVVFSGRYLEELFRAHNYLPQVPLCLNITKCKEFNLDDLFETESRGNLPLPFKMISLKSNLILDKEYAEKCHSLGASALAWGFIQYPEPEKKILKLLKRGIDGILFDSVQTVPLVRKKLNREVLLA